MQVWGDRCVCGSRWKGRCVGGDRCEGRCEDRCGKQMCVCVCADVGRQVCVCRDRCVMCVCVQV